MSPLRLGDGEGNCSYPSGILIDTFFPEEGLSQSKVSQTSWDSHHDWTTTRKFSNLQQSIKSPLCMLIGTQIEGRFRSANVM